MPSSTWAHTSTVQDLVWKYQPKTVLDIGVGFGRWGMLIREQMDVFKGRYPESKWTTKITGIEVWSKYLRPWHQVFYDYIYVGCALEFFTRAKTKDQKFDLIIAGDVLEHFERTEAEKLLSLVRNAANKAAIFCVPLGKGYPQGTVLGNTHEAHLSTWETGDFADSTRVTVIKERIGQRPYGVILYEAQKDDVVFHAL